MQAIWLAAGAFVLAFVVALAINRMKVGDSATFIALLLTPMIVYGVASGKLQEFSAPGGWGAKFRDAAQAAVTPTALTTPLSQIVQQFDIVQKGGLAELQGLGPKLQKDKPIALSFQLGQQNYDVDIATKYIDFLLLTDRDMTVLILDSSHHFVAMTEGTTMLTLLRAPGQQITGALAGGNRDFFVGLPGFHTNTIKATDSNATALEKMRAQNARAIVVVDDQGTPTGVVKRDDIVSRLLEKLATPDK
jgi:CBS domain protein